LDLGGPLLSLLGEPGLRLLFEIGGAASATQKAISSSMEKRPAPGPGSQICAQANTRFPVKTMKEKCFWSPDTLPRKFCLVEDKDLKSLANWNKCKDITKQGHAYFMYPYLDQEKKYWVPTKEVLAERQNLKSPNQSDLRKILAALVFNAQLRNQIKLKRKCLPCDSFYFQGRI
jgi:hypothetical protein